MSDGPSRSRWPFIAAGALLVALIVAFGFVAGDDENDVGTQPAPGVSTFEQGVFDDVPRPPGSVELAPPSETNGTVAASLAVRNTSAGDVMSFYDEALPAEGWEVVESSGELPSGIWSARWERDGADLEITATDGRPDVRVPEAEEETVFEDYTTEVHLAVSAS